jgi:hypothetical protein
MLHDLERRPEAVLSVLRETNPALENGMTEPWKTGIVGGDIL